MFRDNQRSDWTQIVTIGNFWGIWGCTENVYLLSASVLGINVNLHGLLSTDSQLKSKRDKQMPFELKLLNQANDTSLRPAHSLLTGLGLFVAPTMFTTLSLPDLSLLGTKTRFLPVPIQTSFLWLSHETMRQLMAKRSVNTAVNSSRVEKKKQTWSGQVGGLLLDKIGTSTYHAPSPWNGVCLRASVLKNCSQLTMWDQNIYFERHQYFNGYYISNFRLLGFLRQISHFKRY